MNKEEHGKLEIKKLTVSEGQSEETLSFHESIYWLGEKVGAASNDGTGGCNSIVLDEGKIKYLDRMESYASQFTFEIQVPNGKLESVSHSLDTYISDLVYDKHQSVGHYWGPDRRAVETHGRRLKSIMKGLSFNN